MEFAGTARYEIVRPIGAGGMGVVYEAFDRERGTPVAIKTMRAVDAQALFRFKSEFRALADLAHPNLIRLGELVETEGTWFFTMELLEGQGFLAHVRDDSGVDETRLREAFGQLAEGLDALHRAGRIHRDIKPSNVFVTTTGRVVIVDFGLVKDLADGARLVSGVAGTLAYMAPEQASGLPLGPAADWYAAGVLLYQALTGVRPFARDQAQMRREDDEVVPPRDVNPFTPPDLEALCLDLLSYEPELRPRARDVLALLRVRPADPAGLKRQRTPFAGRGEELRRLHEFRRGDAPAAVLVEGDAGIGKSMLARRFVDDCVAERDDTLVLAGRCFERESVPYKALDGVIDSLTRALLRRPVAEVKELLPRHPDALAHLFPVLRRLEAFSRIPPVRADRVDPHQLRSRAFASLRELFVRLCDRRPVIVYIDDLHWADRDGLALLGELLRGPDAPAMLLVGTLRPSSASSQALVGLPCRVLHLPLGRMSDDDARRLIDGSGGQGTESGAISLVSAEQVAELIEESAGHPLFLVELMRRAHRRAGRVRLDEALAHHVAQLSAEAARVLALVAVAGVPLSLQLLGRIVGGERAALVASVEALRAAELVATTGMRWSDTAELLHERVRAAALAALDAASRKQLHHELATALDETAQRDLGALAAHWLAAGDATHAAATLERAAREAMAALAFEQAVGLYEARLELPVTDEQARTLWARLAVALQALGRGVDAARAYQAAAARADGLDRIDLESRAAEHLLRGGHIDEGLRAQAAVLAGIGVGMPRSRAAIWSAFLWARMRLRLRGLAFEARAESELDPELRVRLDACGGAAVGMAVVDPLLGAYYQARYLHVALDAGEPSRVCRALATEAVQSAAMGRKGRDRARLLLARGEALAGAAGAQAAAHVTMGEGVAAFLLGEWERAAEHSGRAARMYRGECAMAGWELGNAELFSILPLFYLGRVAALGVRFRESARAAELRGDLHAMIAQRSGHAALGWLLAGDPQSARRDSQAMRDVAGGRWSTQRGYFEPFAEAHVDLYEGDGVAASRFLDERWPELEASMLLHMELVRVLMVELRGRASLMAAMSRTPAAHLSAAERAARKLEREPAAWAQALGWMLHGGVAAARGRNEEARDRLGAAARRLEEERMHLHAVTIRVRLAQLGAQGDAIDAALSTLRGLGVVEPLRIVRMLAPFAG